MKTANKTFVRDMGRLVRTRRQHLGMTQQALACATGTSERYIVSLELGESAGARLDKLLRVLDALGLTLNVSELDGPLNDGGPLRHPVSKEESEDGYDQAFRRVAENLQGLVP